MSNDDQGARSRETEIREFVHQLLGRSPAAGPGEALYQWERLQQGAPVPHEDVELIRAILAQERARRPRDSSNEVWVGVGVAVVLHVLQIPLAIGVGLLACRGTTAEVYCGLAGVVPIMLIGVTQLLYLGPAALIAHVTHHTAAAKGILLTAAVGFLLNASCYGLVLGPSLLGV